MQIIKPRSIGLLHKTYLWQQQRFAVAGLVFFRLGEMQPVPLIEFEQWGACFGQLAPGNVLDMGFAKARGEVLVSARGYHPGHRLAQASCAVRVGTLQKQLRIPDRAADGCVLEALLPLDVMDKRRQQYNGSYDKRWLQKVHPGFPEDTDARFFQAAASDQQLRRGYFTPGSEYQLQHMHPQLREIGGCLPDRRLRAVVEQQVQGTDTPCFHELAMVLETLWFFPGILLGVALYRGQFACADSDGLDVKRLLLAMEHGADDPRPASYYEDVMVLRSNPLTAVGHLFNEAPLLPQRSAKDEAERQALIAGAMAEQQAAVAARRELHKAKIRQDLAGRLPASHPGQDQLQHALEQPAEDDEIQLPVVPATLMQNWDFDLTPLIEQGTKLQDKLQQELKDKQQGLQDLAASWQQQYADRLPEALETDQAVHQRCSSQVFVEAVDLELPLDATQAPLLQTLAGLPGAQLQELQRQGHLNLAALQQALVLKEKAGKQGRQSAPEPMVKVDLTAQQKSLVRSLVQGWLDTQQSLAGRDLAGADLAGMDFSGRDLRDVMFEFADLQDCRFAGAQLDGAVFSNARLDRADFSGASLQKANFCKASGTGVNFSNAVLHSALLMSAELRGSDCSGIAANRLLAQGADLSGGRFDHAQLQEALLGDAILTMSTWEEAALQSCILMNAVLEQSSWRRARLYKCIAVNVRGAHADFSEARLDSVQFSNAGSLQGASFHGSYCQSVGFRGLDLDGFGARGAVFKDCDFCETNLRAADLRKSLFSNCLLMQIDAPLARCEETFFSGSIVRKVDFCKSNFNHAEFSQCTLAQVNFDGCSTRQLRRHPRPAA